MKRNCVNLFPPVTWYKASIYKESILGHLWRITAGGQVCTRIILCVNLASMAEPVVQR